MTIGAGCGRLGFELLESNTEGDASSGSDLVSPDARDSDGGIPGCLSVDTESDEDDPGESAEPPHLGSGLSLREAIGLANRAPGADCIRFARPLTVAIPGGDLPAAADPDGLSIDGAVGRGADDPAASAARLTGSGAGVGLAAELGSVAIRNLQITGFAACIIAGADEGALGPGLEVHGCGAGIEVTGDGVQLRGVHSRDHAGHGIAITGDRADLAQVLVHDCGGDGIRARGTAGLVIRHATVALNLGAGIDARAGASGATVLNTIVSRNGGAGVAVDSQASLARLGYSDFFEDTCEGCTPGTGSITSDPRFTDLDRRRLTLKAGSPCADRGVDTGLDVSGNRPGLYSGDAPDIGAFESN